MYLHTLFFYTPFSFYAFPFFYTFTLCLLSSGSVLAILCFFLLPALLLFDTSFVSSIAFACSSRKFPKAAARSAGTIQQAGYKYRRFPFFGDSRQTPKIKNTGKNSSIDVYLLCPKCKESNKHHPCYYTWICKPTDNRKTTHCIHCKHTLFTD